MRRPTNTRVRSSRWGLFALASLLVARCEDSSVTQRDAARDRASSVDVRALTDAADATISDASNDVQTIDVPSVSDVIVSDVGRDAATADSSSCAGRAFGQRCADGLVCDGRGACAVRRPCAFESAGRWLYPDGAARRLLETVFAYGRYYNFWINPDGSYEPLNAGGNVTAMVDRWRGATQACAGASDCSFDSFDLFQGAGAMGSVLMESITRLGRYYNYTSEGGYRLLGSGLLEDVPRFSTAFNGPCTGQIEGSCRFDTRSLVVNWATGQTIREEITTRGARWVYDGAGRPVASVPLGQRLDAVARYVPADGVGPCAGRSACRFDAQFHDPSTGDEFVVANGRLWVWANDSENTRRFALGHGNELHTFARYATGPCRVAP